MTIDFFTPIRRRPYDTSAASQRPRVTLRLLPDDRRVLPGARVSAASSAGTGQAR
jgi:hypothetical protein